MAPFIDIVSKFERSFSYCGKNFRQFIDPKKGLTQLLNNLKRTEAENSLEQVIEMVKNRKGPFDLEVVKKYYDEYKKVNSKIKK